MVEIVQLQTYTMHYWHKDEAFLKSLFDRLIYKPQCKGMGRPSSLINLLQSDLYQQGLKIRLNLGGQPRLSPIIYRGSILNLPDFAKNVKNPFNFLIFS